MRILNRPMFKYGGPIKEGIMHGMKNGGTAGVGYGLVGDQRYPKTGGREHHWLFAPWLLGGAATAARVGIPMAARAVASRVGSAATGQAARSALQGGAAQTTKNIAGNVAGVGARGWKNLGQNWFSGDPLVKGSKWGWKTLTSPTANTWAQKGVKMAISPSSIIAGVAWYMWPDGKERKTPPPQGIERGPPGGGDPGMFATPEGPKPKSPAEVAAEAKAERNARLEKYLDTMGYDKAKKGAIGDALIDASAIVQAGTEEAGSLKKADWGKMINQAIQTTSKRLDKPEQIREAVGLMMTKADIEKDMNKDDKALARVLTERRIDVLDKQLEGETLEDSINMAFQKSGNFPTGSTLAGIARTKGLDIETVINSKTITDFLKKNPKSDAMDFMVQNVATAKKEGVPIPPGNYVVKNRIIAVDTEGNLTEVL